jgi:hypothetical protein
VNAAESEAVQLVKQLKEHCEDHGLPILCLVGLPNAGSVARAWNDQSAMNREIFLEQVRALLQPNQN